jgi:hypothetical protein
MFPVTDHFILCATPLWFLTHNIMLLSRLEMGDPWALFTLWKHKLQSQISAFQIPPKNADGQTLSH